MIELLGTKLFIPRPRKNLVVRPRLVEHLNARLDKKLTLIAAPAGFGKTTLLSEWIPKSPRCVTWFSLDDGDNDLTRFWVYFISSLQTLRLGLGETALVLLQSPQVPPISSILTTLLNDITSFSDAFAFVLDDYHVIEFQPIHESLTFLIDHMPNNMHLVITTRADPPLPLSRLRARDRLTELRANNLRFTAGEAAEFLTNVMGLNLLPEEVATLDTRTEGWIAGLQIAALSMQGFDDISGFIQAFSGSHRHILGYLADEVLNQRPKGTLNFLQQTSILDRLCGPLCDAVTGGTDGQEMLESLEHANLFITPLDAESKWYRYHHMFAEVLQARLNQIQPDQVSELHRRAGDWYAQNGLMDEAVHHAIASADFETAARLIEAVAGNMLLKGSSSSLIHWLNAIPDDVIRARPHLCIAQSWIFLWGSTPHLPSAIEWMEFASQIILNNKSADRNTIGELSALQAWIAAIQWDIPTSRWHSQHALDYLPDESPWRGVMVYGLGTALYYNGDISTAIEILNEAIRLSRTDGAQYIQLMAASFLADLKVRQGHLGQASNMYQQILQDGNELPQRGIVMAHSGIANILYECNQLETALNHLQLGEKLLEQVGGAWIALALYVTLARVQQAQGDSNNALTTLDHAWQIGQNAQVDYVMQQVATTRARLHILQGDLNSVEDWVKKTGIGSDDQNVNHHSFRENDYLVFTQVLISRGRHSEALSLLAQLLEPAEAEGRYASVIAILVLQSVIYQSQSRVDLAFQALERALTLAEPEGYIRTFVDEGEPMRQMLLDFQTVIKKRISESVDSESLRFLKYTDKLLAAFSQPALDQRAKDESLLGPLNERELDVLRLIATGRNNKEIAEILMIAVSTVKWYINNLYSKLGAKSRTHALALAKELELI